MSEEFFNRASGEDVYLNNPGGRSGHDWWYETMPNIFFYQLNELYPHTGDFDSQFTSVAGYSLNGNGDNFSIYQNHGIPYNRKQSLLATLI